MFKDVEEILTAAEVAELLSIGENRVYQLLNSGQIKALKLGRTWRIPKESVELYIRESSGLKYQSVYL